MTLNQFSCPRSKGKSHHSKPAKIDNELFVQVRRQNWRLLFREKFRQIEN